MNWPACRFDVVHARQAGTRAIRSGLCDVVRHRRHRDERILLELPVFEHDVDRRIAIAADEAIAVVVEREAELAVAGDGFELAA